MLAVKSSLNRQARSKHGAALLRQKRELGRNARNGPLVRHGPHQARKTSPGILSIRAVRLEPGRKPNNTSRRASSLPGVGAPGKLLSSDRTNHTRRRVLEPPCLPAGDQRFCGPQSRQARVVALRRALWRLRRLGTNQVSCGLGAGRASKGALRRSGETCVVLAGWPGALVTAGARVALARVFSQSPVHAQGSKSSQCPNAVSQNQRAQCIEPCV